MPYRLLHFNFGKLLTVSVGSLCSVFIPVQELALIVLLFIIIDFIVGLVVSFRVRKQGFLSDKAYRTVWKILGAETCVLLAFLLDAYVITFASLYLANIFAGIICGADLWSILTNFAILSNHPVFRLIKKWGKSEIESKMEGLKDFDKELHA
jgi:phage-related holin